MVGRDAPASSAGDASPPAGPADCAARDRAADAASAVNDMATMLNGMDRDVVRRLVNAREAAVALYKAFPEGDRRFDSVETDSDEEDGEGEGEGEGDETDDDILSEDAGGEACKGLLDDVMDPSAQACLRRAKEEHGFDVVAEMDDAGLAFFERIRVVNYVRNMVVNDGRAAGDALSDVRNILKTKDAGVLSDDKLLEPVIEGDLLLTVLESGQDLDDSAKDESEDVSEAVRESLRASHIIAESE